MNRPPGRADTTSSSPHWVFGYGSLIYKVDFPYLRREIASLAGWQRRFWQGSHDHRGTPDAPGRVLTLIPEPGAVCRGGAFQVEETVFDHLDYREKNGYERHDTSLLLHPQTASEDDEQVEGTVYIASPDNPAYLGDAPIGELARHIARSEGPSGTNREYLLKLDEALRQIDASDSHVTTLAQAVRELPSL